MLKQLLIFSLLAFYAVSQQQDCLNVIETLEVQLESLTHFATWESSNLRSSSLNAVVSAIEQAEQVCQMCVGDVEFIVGQVKQLVSDAENHDWTTLISEAFSAIQNAKAFYNTCLAASELQFVAAESCVNVVASVKGVLSQLTSLKTWENSQLRGNLLESLLSFVSQVEGSCKTCATEALSLEAGVKQIIADAQQSQWLELIGEVIQVLLQADQVYNCAKGSSSMMEFVAADSCVNVVESAKAVLGQLVDIKNWESSDLRTSLLSNLVAQVVNIEQQCKDCADDALALKSGILQVVADAKSKQWLSLIGEVITLLTQADAIYNCAEGQSSISFVVQAPQAQPSCLSEVVGVKQALLKLTDLKNWESSELRGDLFSDLAGVLVGIEGSCKQCLPDASSLKADVLQLIADSRSKQWLALIGQVVSLLSEADGLYQCLNADSQFTLLVASQQCLSAIQDLKNNLGNLGQGGNVVSNLLSDLGTLQSSCSACESNVETVVSDVKAAIQDFQQKNWLGLIGTALTASSTVESFLQSCGS